MTKSIKLTFLSLIVFALMSASCEKDKPNNPSQSGNVPAEAQGQWQYGSASMTEIWNTSNNSYLGNAFELSVMFDFKPDGTYTQYFVAGSASLGGCRTNVFNIESGTVDFDKSNNTFTTHPTKVKNKFYNCGTVSNSEKTTGLKSGTYVYEAPTTAPNGTRVFKMKPKEAGNYSTFYKK